MLVGVILFESNNCPTLPHRLWSLTNSCANLILALACALAVCRKDGRWLLVFLGGGCASAGAYLPLSNTLFWLHPPALFLGLSAAFVKNCGQGRPAHKPHLLTAAAITGGGFWSLQELNWGGWWNWDVLELSSAATWIWICAQLHAARSKRVKARAGACAAAAAAFFYAANKSGAGTSIHSFVTSDVLKTNYVAICVCAAAAVAGARRPELFAVALCASMYTSLVSGNALKKLTVLSLAATLRRGGWARKTHSVMYAAAAFFVAFNAQNQLIAFARTESQGFRSVFWSRNLKLCLDGPTLVHSGGWRSKPQNSAGCVFKSTQTRSTAGRYKQFAYLK